MGFPSWLLLVTLAVLHFGRGTVSSVSLARDGGDGSTEECGKIRGGRRMFHARIMGGTKIRITDFPHAISLRKDDKHHCGGTLIHRSYVLTAAHCVHSYSADVWTVSVGDQNSRVHEDHEREFGVAEVVQHPRYKYPKFVHDLALLRLKKPVEWSAYAQPACLPEPTHLTGRGRGYLAGWGLDGERRKGGEPTDEIHLARLPIMENGQCKEWFRRKGKSVDLAPEHVCAGREEGEVDGCQGDSGGGLVTVEDDRLVLVGVMSAGIGCGRPGLPGVYTRVEKFVPWLQEQIKKRESAAAGDGK